MAMQCVRQYDTGGGAVRRDWYLRTEGLMKVPNEDAIAPKPKGRQIVFPNIFFGNLPKVKLFLMHQINFPCHDTNFDSIKSRLVEI